LVVSDHASLGALIFGRIGARIRAARSFSARILALGGASRFTENVTGDPRARARAPVNYSQHV